MNKMNYNSLPEEFIDLYTRALDTSLSLGSLSVEGYKLSGGYMTTQKTMNQYLALQYAKELIDVCDDAGMTPMHIAAINFDLHIYDLLIQLGPNKNIKDKEGKTCIDYLRENDDVEVPKKYLRNE